jgi:transposase
MLRYLQQMTGKAAAGLLNIPKSTLSNLLHRVIKRIRSGHKIRGLTILGVDEISYARGHKYATIAYDLDRSKVIWVGKGKGGETLELFLKTCLSEHQRGKIKYACCDMGQAYIGVIKKCLKNTTLIIDRFHVVKALNEAMDEVRKEEWRKVEKSDKKFLKGLRWILFRNSSTRSKGQTRTANKLRLANNRIYRAWLLKDEFEHFWDYQYKGSAIKFLKSWTTRALKSRLEPMRKFVKTFRGLQEHILPFLETGITNAKGEGINRILQMVKGRASGFANLGAFSDLIFLVIGDLDIPAQIPKKFQTI